MPACSKGDNNTEQSQNIVTGWLSPVAKSRCWTFRNNNAALKPCYLYTCAHYVQFSVYSTPLGIGNSDRVLAEKSELPPFLSIAVQKILGEVKTFEGNYKHEQKICHSNASPAYSSGYIIDLWMRTKHSNIEAYLWKSRIFMIDRLFWTYIIKLGQTVAHGS